MLGCQSIACNVLLQRESILLIREHQEITLFIWKLNRLGLKLWLILLVTDIRIKLGLWLLKERSDFRLVIAVLNINRRLGNPGWLHSLDLHKRLTFFSLNWPRLPRTGVLYLENIAILNPLKIEEHLKLEACVHKIDNFKMIVAILLKIADKL